MNRKLFLVAAIAAVTIGCSTAAPNLESYSGHAIVMGSIGTAANQTVQIAISRWTTAAERSALLETLQNDGPEAFRTAIFKSEETGFLSIAGRTTYRMRYAYATQTPEGRQIILATDRELGIGEVRSPGAHTRDYNITVIVLNVDENGSGSGAISVGTEVWYDNLKDTLVLKNFSTEPVRLNSISRIE